jgi:hypothetical protein
MPNVDGGGGSPYPTGAAQQGIPAVGNQAYGWTGSAPCMFNVEDMLGMYPIIPGGRLTSDSADPWKNTSNSAPSTIYYLPAVHDFLDLYDGVNNKWVARQCGSTGISLALSGLSSGKCYDVFAYWTGSAVALELGAAWTTNTAGSSARATTAGIAFQGGRAIKQTAATPTYDLTRRWLGTILATGATTVQDNVVGRYISNAYNRIPLQLQKAVGTATWAYSTATTRVANNSTANECDFVCALESPFWMVHSAAASSDTIGVFSAGIGLNTTSAYTSPIGYLSALVAADTVQTWVMYNSVAPIGFNYLSALETGLGSGNQTWSSNGQIKLQGWVMG